MIGILGVEY